MDSAATLTGLLLGWMTLSFWPWIGALIGITAAQARGYHALLGLVAGLGMGPFALLIYLTHLGVQCPYCCEWVRKDARKCKHCHSELEPALKPLAPLQEPRVMPPVVERPRDQKVVQVIQDGDVWRCGNEGCGRQIGGPKGECPQCGALNYRA